jgi:hypothetical protein
MCQMTDEPHLFEQVLFSIEHPQDARYHADIARELNGRVAKQRAGFLKEFTWYYHPGRKTFMSEANIILFEWLKHIGVKF